MVNKKEFEGYICEITNKPIREMRLCPDMDALIKFMNGESDDFEPIPIPKEVDDEMQKDRFY